MERPKIVITIEGGTVSNVLANMTVDVAIINYDVEGEEVENLKKIPQGPVLPPSNAIAHVETAEIVKQKRLSELFEAVRGDDS